MEWTKLHTSLIVNRVPDKDILAITKYQLLWAELEHEPDEPTALRYMSANQLAIARQYLADISADVCADISSVSKSRNRRRKNYIKNKENSKIVTHTVTHTVPSTVTHTVRKQIRTEQIREDNKLLTAPTSAGCVQPKPRQLTDLQKFAVRVLEQFEPDVQTKEQKAIWYKRNCRCLTDILRFCEKDIPLALKTIDICLERLEKAGLHGGYEAVCRNLPEYYSAAKMKQEGTYAKKN